MRPRQSTDNNNRLAWEENIKVWDSQASEAVMSPLPNETACRRFSHSMNER